MAANLTVRFFDSVTGEIVDRPMSEIEQDENDARIAAREIELAAQSK